MIVSQSIQRLGKRKVILFSMDSFSREELINLSGQVANGMLSSDSSFLSKLVATTLHKQIADVSVDIAYHILKRIDEVMG